MIILLLLSAFLVGCASQSVNKKDEGTEDVNLKGQDRKAEQINNVRISEFILGVRDTIDITVYRQDDLKRSVTIDSSGKIMFPLIGDVRAAGKGVFALRDEIQEKLAKYIVDPQVTINVAEVRSQKVMVLGEVNSPGIFALDSDISVLEAISNAGGATDDAKINNVLLIRRGQDKPEVTSLNLKKLFKEGDLSQNRILQNGDIIYLPAVAIADVSWFFSHLSKILAPIVSLGSGVVVWDSAIGVLQGKEAETSVTIPIQ